MRTRGRNGNRNQSSRDFNDCSSIKKLIYNEGDIGVYRRYCGIELFFKWFFGNLNFNVRYCGII